MPGSDAHGLPDLTVELVDDLGELWTPDAAAAQLERFVQAGDAMPGPLLRPEVPCALTYRRVAPPFDIP
jgi:hypothetical protein